MALAYEALCTTVDESSVFSSVPRLPRHAKHGARWCGWNEPTSFVYRPKGSLDKKQLPTISNINASIKLGGLAFLGFSL